jgi:hypothetical protein
MDDADWQHCRRGASKALSWHVVIIALVPVLFVFCGDRAAGIALDGLFLGGSASFLLLNHVLLQAGVVVLMIPYVVILLWLCWRLGVFRAAKALHDRRGRSTFVVSTLAPLQHRFHARSAVRLSPNTSATLAPMEALRRMCLSAVYWATPFSYFARRRERKLRLVGRWAGANRPRHMGPSIPSASSVAAAATGEAVLLVSNETDRDALRQIERTFLDPLRLRAGQESDRKMLGTTEGVRSLTPVVSPPSPSSMSQWQRELGAKRGELVAAPSARVERYQRHYQLATDVDTAWRMAKHVLRLVTPQSSSSPSVAQLDETQVMLVLVSLFPLRCRPRGRCLSLEECSELRQQCARWFQMHSVVRGRQCESDDRANSAPLQQTDPLHHNDAVVKTSQFRKWFAYVFDWYAHSQKHRRMQVSAGQFEAKYLPVFVDELSRSPTERPSIALISLESFWGASAPTRTTDRKGEESATVGGWFSWL